MLVVVTVVEVKPIGVDDDGDISCNISVSTKGIVEKDGDSGCPRHGEDNGAKKL